MTNSPNILIMAGGTGGHIYPALSVASELMSRGYKVSWLGSEGGMEQELVSRESIPMHLLPVKGVRGKGRLALIKAPFILALCVFKAMCLIVSTRTKLVIGFGGFASGPGGIAGTLLAKKLVIHEQNAIAGFTNRMLSKFANIICQAFEGAFKPSAKVVTTGNPIRQSLIGLIRENKNLGSRPIRVLVIGGSRGAKVFNDYLPEIFRPLLIENRICVWHQTGKGNLNDVNAYYNTFSGDVKVDEFIHTMDEAYRWADLIVCRAGALTVSEVAVVGLPAIFVPYPFAVDDHQTANASALADRGAAKIINQNKIEQIESVLNELVEKPDNLLKMSRLAKSLAVTNASTKIADFCESLIKSNKV